jgi:enoyl reductase-like protein
VKRINLGKMTVEQLVDRFVEIALEQDRVERMDEDVAMFNRLYDRMEEVEAELKNRDGDERSSLLPLFEHPNAQVRLKAALATLALAPMAAREVLQDVSNSNRYPQAADAREMLGALDDGTYTPT